MRTEKDEIELERGVSFREGLGGSGVPGGPYSDRVASFPQNPMGFGHPVPVFSRCARQSSRQVGRELLRRPEALWTPPRNHPSTGVAYRSVRIVSSAELGSQLRRQIGRS